MTAVRNFRVTMDRGLETDVDEKQQRNIAAAKAFVEKMSGIEHLSHLNGQVSSLGRERLADVLGVLDLDARGHRDVLMKRLKNHFRNERLREGRISFDGKPCPVKATAAVAASTSQRRPRRHKSFDFLCVVDFEATCHGQDRTSSNDFKPEIIEFPAILIDTRSSGQGDTRLEFHRFCRPRLSPKLTDFCTDLTGITQETVDRSADFILVLDEFLAFIADNVGVGNRHSWAIVTDSQYDMCHFMAHQCDISGIPFPQFAKEWINIRKTFSNFYGCQRLRLVEMLEKLGMTFEGRQHSGLDDARNILRVCLTLMADGAHLKINESVNGDAAVGVNGRRLQRQFK